MHSYISSVHGCYRFVSTSQRGRSVTAETFIDLQVVMTLLPPIVPVHIKALLAGNLFLQCLIIIHLHLLLFVINTLHQLHVPVDLHPVWVVSSSRRDQSRGSTLSFLECEHVVPVLKVVLGILLVV